MLPIRDNAGPVRFLIRAPERKRVAAARVVVSRANSPTRGPMISIGSSQQRKAKRSQRRRLWGAGRTSLPQWGHRRKPPSRFLIETSSLPFRSQALRQSSSPWGRRRWGPLGSKTSVSVIILLAHTVPVQASWPADQSRPGQKFGVSIGRRRSIPCRETCQIMLVFASLGDRGKGTSAGLDLASKCDAEDKGDRVVQPVSGVWVGSLEHERGRK